MIYRTVPKKQKNNSLKLKKDKKWKISEIIVVTMNHHAKYLHQRSFWSKVIVRKDRHTHPYTQPTDCFILLLKLSSKSSRRKTRKNCTQNINTHPNRKALVYEATSDVWRSVHHIYINRCTSIWHWHQYADETQFRSMQETSGHWGDKVTTSRLSRIFYGSLPKFSQLLWFVIYPFPKYHENPFIFSYSVKTKKKTRGWKAYLWRK